MKTVQELRQLVPEHGDKCAIGALVFENNDGDVDVHFDDDLIQWFSKEVDGVAQLDHEDAFTKSSSLSKRREKLAEARSEIERLTEDNAGLQKRASEASLALGKVEAYEKLLVGRGVTISA